MTTNITSTIIALIKELPTRKIAKALLETHEIQWEETEPYEDDEDFVATELGTLCLSIESLGDLFDLTFDELFSEREALININSGGYKSVKVMKSCGEVWISFTEEDQVEVVTRFLDIMRMTQKIHAK